MKNRQKTIGIKERLNIKLKNVNELLTYAVMLLAHSCKRTIHEKADRITESAKCLDKIKANNMKQGVFVEQDYQSY